MRMFALLFVTVVALVAPRAIGKDESPAASIIGAWRIVNQSERVMIVTPHYWTQANYDREQRKFLRTFGGSWTPDGDVISGWIEFDSENPKQVGTGFVARVRVENGDLKLTDADGNVEVWSQIDAGESALAGTWRITGRQADGKFSEMPLRARRTLKILSGTRFQWVAMNVETGEFSGTGGGTYTFQNGKYTEHIEFFSRDGSRVGARLEFDGEVSGDNWRHRGLSSRGDPIDEVWSRFVPPAK
jgi:hypothetical protein